jgi:N-acetylmuramoyl-L-alanine amidase
MWRTTLAAVRGLPHALGRRAGFVLGAAVGIAALVAAGVDGATGAHAVPPRTVAPRTVAQPPAKPAAAPAATDATPLKGKVVGIDPGHNGRNHTDPAYLNRQVWNGREWEDCDTTGTVTDGGYTEALFNFRVAEYLRADLIRDGARVVMTRTTNDGLGPCVNLRSFIINGGHANVAVDIHADGGPVGGRGFAVLEPVADGVNDKVITSSARFGADVRAAMLAGTQMPVSDYDGKNGINHRDDLAGLNLTKVPKILIEVGNMKNATDVKLLTSAKFQQEVARALQDAIIAYLR